MQMLSGPAPSVMDVSEDERAWFAHSLLGIVTDLVSTAHRLTRNSAEAEDLVAEAIAQAWLHFPSLRDRERFRGWIFRILTNLYLSQRRALGCRPPEEPFDEGAVGFSLFEHLHQPFLLWCSSPEQEFLDQLAREDLVRAIESLPELYRIVVTLVDIQDFSYRDVAQLLHIPIGTVRSRLARARSLLQSALWELAIDSGLLPPHTSRKPGAR